MLPAATAKARRKPVVIRPPPVFRLLRRSLAHGIPVQVFQFVIEGKAHGE